MPPLFAVAIASERPGTRSHFADVGWIDNFEDPSAEDQHWHFDYNCLSFDVLRMTGNGVGPSTAPGDLEGDVKFTLGPGCGPYDYGYGRVANGAPTAVASAKPTTAAAGEPIAFDGSDSYDDRDTIDTLSFKWDTDGDGTFESTGSHVVHAYSQPGTYHAVLEVADSSGLTSRDTVAVTITAPDLKVTSASSSTSSAKQGDRVTLTASVTNSGSAGAPASKTEFKLDDGTVIGTVDTPSLAPGASATVSTPWSTKGVKGDHVITVTADSAKAVGESNETNNSSTLSVSVKGNKVANGSFEQPNDAGTAPASWSSSGSTSYSSNGTDGSKAATTNGLGTWTSAPIPVTPGQALDVVASVTSLGTVSPPAVGVTFLGTLGNVVQSLTAATGVGPLAGTVTVPLGVAQARVVLTGAPAGTVTFDDVGLFDH